MSQSYTIGWVTRDLELKKSAKGVNYVRFSLRERIGHGENFRMQYLQVCAFGRDAENLIAFGVGKGTMIWVSGELTLEDFQKLDMTPDKRLKVMMDRWGLIRKGKQQSGEDAPDTEAIEEMAIESEPPIQVIDGDREELPG